MKAFKQAVKTTILVWRLAYINDFILSVSYLRTIGMHLYVQPVIGALQMYIMMI